MTGEKQENSPGEKEKSQENSGRIAHCLNCSNEWIPRDQGNKKRKCPVCGKYRVAWKDELIEKKPDSSVSTGENTGEIGEKQENSPKEKEKSQEKTQEKSEDFEDDEFLSNSPGEIEEKNEEEKLKEAMKKSGGLSPFMVIGAIFGLAGYACICWFLSRRDKKKNLQQNPVPPVNSRVQNAVKRLY